MATEYAKLVLTVDSSDVDRADKKLDDLEDQTKRTTSSANLLKAAFATLIASQTLRKVTQYADAWTNIENRLKLVTSGTEELTRAQNDLLKVAQDTRQSFDSTAQLFQRMSSNAESLGLSYEDLVGITKTVNESMAVSGATAQESAAAIIQLGQAIGSGELRGDEFRSIAEQAPRLRDALVDGLGVDGVGALRDLAEAGELTSERVIIALQSQADVINEEFSGMDVTVSQAATTMSNSFTSLIGRMNEAIGFTDGLATAMMGLAEVMEVGSGGLTLNVLEQQLIAAERHLGVMREGTRAYETQIERVKSLKEQIESLQATTGGGSQSTTVNIDPLNLSSLVGGASNSIEDQREGIFGNDDFADAAGATLFSIDEMERVFHEKTLERDREAIQAKLDGYSVLTDAASAYFAGMEGKEAAYARAALSIGENLLTEQGRQKLTSLYQNTYDAAMGAYSALASIPIVGPALGAAAFAGIVATGTAAAGSMLSGGRELGGQVLPGRSYLVGERGPEVLTMGSTAGNVSNNVASQQQAEQAPQEIIINQNIQAHDSKDVQRALFENKDYIASIVREVTNDRGMAFA